MKKMTFRQKRDLLDKFEPFIIGGVQFISALNKMDIIEDDKKLREIFSKIVAEYEIRYCA